MSDLDTKIKQAITLLRSAPDKEIELSYSGGKDSDVCLALAKMSGINYRAIYKNTTIDPPGTLSHCREVGAEIVQPKMSFFQIIEKKGMPTFRRRFCCEILKEYKILDNAIQGIRACESENRKKRYKEPVFCRIYGAKENHVNVILPILKWTDKDVEEFINYYGIKCHPLYYREDGTFNVKCRLGCMGCPLPANRGKDDFLQHPKLLRQWLRHADIWYHGEHPRSFETAKKFANVYEIMVCNLFYKSYKAFKLHRDTPYLDGSRMDCKQLLENYFKIDLTF
jgi:phosphoadenosine phosphosulfate reductase